MTKQPFERIAGTYRCVNRFISLFLDNIWRRRAVRVLEVRPGDRILDIGCGAGELLELIKDRSCQRIGLDPERKMLLTARVVYYRLSGCVEVIPLKSSSVNRVISGFAIRNFADRRRGFEEMFRVLKPGGGGVLIDFSPPDKGIIGSLIRLYLILGVPAIGGILSGDFSAYRYLSRTILAFPSPDVIKQELARVGLSNVTWERLVGGVTVLYKFEKSDE